MGSEPQSVYWRRRLILLGAVALVVVLIALTVNAVTGSSGTPQAGSSSAPRSGAPATAAATSRSGSTTVAPRTSASRSASTSPSKAATSASGGATPAACTPTNLKVSAVVGKSTYKVGDKLLVELQVVNTGSAPCVQDLSDKQIELRVYNGASRVWGSHDCAVQPGTDKRTLAVGQPYRSAVLWGGLTSEPKCTQTARQRIGAGTYTLYAALAGRTGTAAQFNVS